MPRDRGRSNPDAPADGQAGPAARAPGRREPRQKRSAPPAGQQAERRPAQEARRRVVTSRVTQPPRPAGEDVPRRQRTTAAAIAAATSPGRGDRECGRFSSPRPAPRPQPRLQRPRRDAPMATEGTAAPAGGDKAAATESPPPRPSRRAPSPQGRCACGHAAGPVTADADFDDDDLTEELAIRLSHCPSRQRAVGGAPRRPPLRHRRCPHHRPSTEPSTAESTGIAAAMGTFPPPGCRAQRDAAEGTRTETSPSPAVNVPAGAAITDDSGAGELGGSARRRVDQFGCGPPLSQPARCRPTPGPLQMSLGDPERDPAPPRSRPRNRPPRHRLARAIPTSTTPACTSADRRRRSLCAGAALRPRSPRPFSTQILARPTGTNVRQAIASALPRSALPRYRRPGRSDHAAAISALAWRRRGKAGE